jgi:hypothetical protein
VVGTIIKSKITVTKILFSIDGTFRLRIVRHKNTLAGSAVASPDLGGGGNSKKIYINIHGIQV